MKPPVWAGLALVLFSPSASDVLGSITEADAIRLFLEESPRSSLVLLQAEAAGAQHRIDTEVSSPTIAYEIEDAAGVRDEFLIVQQELPITRRRTALHQRAEAASAAMELHGARELQSATADLRLAFYDVLYREKVVEILDRNRRDISRTVEMLREREREGEASGYDVLRAEQEAAEIQMAFVKAETAAATARAGFSSFFDESHAMGSAALEGEFTPSALSWEAEEAVAIALSARSDFLALEQEARQQEMGLLAARRSRIPEPVLSAGWKKVEAAGESDTGFVASIMVPLPIFNSGKYEAAHARAASGQVDLRQAILRRTIRAEVESALARFQAARQTALRFGEPVDNRAGELRRIAQLAYDEGENGILELIDAIRTALRMELQALAARHEAKREQIELDRVMGTEVKP